MTDPQALADATARAPYVPGLGPVHPDEDRVQLWRDLLAVNGTGMFLPYDKDRAWGGRKTDQILTAAITLAPDQKLIPVLSGRGKGRVDVHCFGDRNAFAAPGAETAAKLAAEHGVPAANLKWFSNTPDQYADRTVRLQLKVFSPSDADPIIAWEVLSLEAQPLRVQDTFTAFAETAGEGFSYLVAELQDGADHGPILTVEHMARIVGAIGPMRTQPDSNGRARLLGQYFSVLPDRRGSGHGRDLWRAAMQWGQANRADYQLLQTEYAGPSDHLCQSEGLTSLGYLNTLRVPL